MDTKIARQVLGQEIGILRTRSYDSLRDELLERPSAKEIVGPDGRKYQLEMQAFWDDKPGGNLRVIVSIDDGGWRAFFPLNDSFIISPTGDFVGE